MVTLKYIFDLLGTGEFSNISLSRSSTGSLNEEDYEKVVNPLNLGVIDIYKRFKFLENELALHVLPTVSKYYLREDRVAPEHLLSKDLYIAAPEFEEDEGFLNIIEIISIFDEDQEPLILNNRFKTPAIIQQGNDILKISGLTKAQTFNVVYQAFPNRIVIDEDFDPREVNVSIPEVLIDPLLYYIAAKIYKPTGSNDSTANADKSSAYEQKYELAMTKLDLYGLNPKDEDEPDTFEENGWV